MSAVGADQLPVGLVLAGGESRRMGRDKALLAWGDTDLLGHALRRLAAVTSEQMILSGARARHTGRGVAVVTDPAQGALAAVAAGLAAAGGRPVLVLAVDVPLVTSALLGRLVELLPGHDAVVPVSARGDEPLSAVYGPACLDAMRRRLAAGQHAMTAFWPDVRLRRVAPEELEAFGDPEQLFLNVNTDDAYARAAARRTSAC